MKWDKNQLRGHSATQFLSVPGVTNTVLLNPASVEFACARAFEQNVPKFTTFIAMAQRNVKTLAAKAFKLTKGGAAWFLAQEDIKIIHE